jgi:hypothetical protein
MNVTTMIRKLRDRLKDNPLNPDGGANTSARQWSDEQMVEMLNSGYQQVQKEILKVDSEPWIKMVTVDVTSGLEYYYRPTDCWWETEIAVLDSESINGTGWRTIQRQDTTMVAESFDAMEQRYDRRGQYFFIRPAPSTTVADGLRITYVNILSLNLDDLSDPIIPVPLHMAIVVWAHRLAINETDEDSSDIRQTLQDLLGDLSVYYYKHGRQPDQLIPDIDNGNGQRIGSGIRTYPGRYSRRG